MFINLDKFGYQNIQRAIYLNLAQIRGVVYPVSIITGLILGFVAYGSFCIWQSGKGHT